MYRAVLLNRYIKRKDLNVPMSFKEKVDFFPTKQNDLKLIRVG